MINYIKEYIIILIKLQLFTNNLGITIIMHI